MAKDRRLSVRMIAEETGLDKSAVHRILTDHLHMRKICAKLVCSGTGNLALTRLQTPDRPRRT